VLHWEAAVVAKTCHDVVAWHTEHTAMEGAKSALGGRGSHPQKMRVWPVPRKADYAGAHNGKPDKCEVLRSAYSVARRGISQLEEGMRVIVWCARVQVHAWPFGAQAPWWWRQRVLGLRKKEGTDGTSKQCHSAL